MSKDYIKQIMCVAFTGVLLLSGCSKNVTNSGDPENLPEDFIFGMDASSVLVEEKGGVKYYGFGIRSK